MTCAETYKTRSSPKPDRRFSAYCWRIRLALAHKEFAVETIPWRFTEKDEIAPSGQKLVPVLVDGDRWVADFLEYRELLRGNLSKFAFSLWRYFFTPPDSPLFQPR